MSHTVTPLLVTRDRLEIPEHDEVDAGRTASGIVFFSRNVGDSMGGVNRG
ncbi:MAG: hypothetical protein NTX17_04595 [Candidatus Eisenbacteria bacterium]|nr:hypothetical protein [Candidatus Eisenbacteria bacterium]